MQPAVVLNAELGLELLPADGADVPRFRMRSYVFGQLARLGPEGTLRTLVLGVGRMLEDQSMIRSISQANLEERKSSTSLIQWL